MSVLRRLIVLCSVAAISASLFGQSVLLNPTVKVLPNARTIVPPECVEGGAPAPIIAEAPRETAPAAAAVPPSIDLKTRLRGVQAAAERDDRDAFKRALADARSTVNAYPTGGERDAATDVMQVDSDLEKIWDYAFNAASGAFIDANSEGGVMTSIIRRYPDYNRFIRDATLTVGGQVIYPTRETRQFLTAEAAKRLARLGVRVPARVAEQPPPPVPQPQPRVPPTTKPAPSVKVTTPARPAKHPTTTAHHAPAKSSHRQTPPKEVASASVTPRKPRVAEKTTTSPPASTGGEVPVPHKTTKTTTPQPPAPSTQSERAAGGGGAPPIATATDTTATSTTSPAQRPGGGGGRMNVLFAVILIVVGIGVLIVLFRASD